MKSSAGKDVPRYVMVRNDLARAIRAGSWAAHAQLPSISELMERYGLSDGPVKRALRELQQAGLLYTVPGRGCFVSDQPTARPQRAGDAVALLYGRKVDEVVGNLFFSGVLQGMERELCSHGLGLELVNLQRFPLADIVAARRSGAMPMALVYTKMSQQEMEALVAAGGATVSLFIEYDPIPGLTCLVSDELAGARAATEHLIGSGSRNPAAIQAMQPISYARDRLRGFCEAVEDEFGSCDESCIEAGQWTFDSGYLAMQALLERHPDTDGVFAANDAMAIGAIGAIMERGLRIPDDVRIVGYDDVEIAAAFRPSLTTMRVDREAFGRRAVRTLIDRRGKPTDSFALDRTAPVLVVRQSTGG